MNKYKKILFIISVILLIVIVGFKIIARIRLFEHQKIFEASTIRVIDDFNDRRDSNLVGGKEFIETSPQAFCKAKYDKVEVHGETGF